MSKDLERELKCAVNAAVGDVGGIITDFVESLCFSAGDDECAKAVAMADKVNVAIDAMRANIFRIAKEVS